MFMESWEMETIPRCRIELADGASLESPAVEVTLKGIALAVDEMRSKRQKIVKKLKGGEGSPSVTKDDPLIRRITEENQIFVQEPLTQHEPEYLEEVEDEESLALLNEEVRSRNLCSPLDQ